ncbi:hypothetical protein JOQ06_011636 [Pogonophryne albipinna]|uniref:Uncharacterized protein n=1 Tax=Pogonophryne albipinna TaxID=1090488 RepID=A0AAD6BFA4_9TELE|nr:hypothetical protein JOQ06_011636 [Pogonophryne albipinna]
MHRSKDSGHNSSLKHALPHSPPPLHPQSSPHPGWSKSHLKLWNCIPFSSPIDSGAVSKTNGGFRKSILMKEKERGKESFCPKLQQCQHSCPCGTVFRPSPHSPGPEPCVGCVPQEAFVYVAIFVGTERVVGAESSSKQHASRVAWLRCQLNLWLKGCNKSQSPFHSGFYSARGERYNQGPC